jgi:CDP-diacylglycerol--serine O-phosphatidyltransferase
MLFDGLDGAAARWTNQTSEFGAQLDSLCDAISFGAAPAFLMLALAQPLGFHPRVLWVVAALYVVCAVLRLARFNVEPDEDHRPGEFKGLPSPAAAAVVASFPIMLHGPQLMSGDEPTPEVPWLVGLVTRMVPLVTLGVACLMVSQVRYVHLFRQLVGGRRSGPYLVKVVFAVAVIVAVPRVAIPLLACWYAFATPTLALWNRHLRPRPPAPPLPPPVQNGNWPRAAPPAQEPKAEAGP